MEYNLTRQPALPKKCCFLFFKCLIMMKLVVFFVLFSTAHATSISHAQTINLKLIDETLENAFTSIRKQTGYRFIYKQGVLDDGLKVSLELKEAPLDLAIEKLFQGQPLDFSIHNGTIVVKAKPVLSAKLGAKKDVFQQRNITGKVTDESGQALVGVTVTVKGTNIATSTDENGTYTLTASSNSRVLLFSLIGFSVMEKNIGNNNVVDAVLEEQVDDLDEVVVVGYGTQRKVNLTGSVAQVSGEELTKRNASNTSVAIQGMMPGVSVVTSSGRPGYDGAGIKVRGTGSLNSENAPLVLIDGVEGYMNFLDPNSIESITVLKDAASASIYGSKAANGVVLVTTKRGKQGKVVVNYSGYSGFNTPTNLPKPLSGLEYMEALNVARANNNQSPQYPESVLDIYRNGEVDNQNYYDTDWRKHVIKNQALTHNNSLSISGGNDFMQTFLNAGHYFQKGNIANNDFKRTTLKLNNDFKISSMIKAGVDLNIRQSTVTSPAYDTPESIINKATTFVPVFSGINSDGTWGYGQNGDNPIASAEVSGVSTAINPELGIKGFVSITPFEGFEINTSYSTNKLDTKGDFFLKPYDTYEGGVFKVTYPASGNQKSESWGHTIRNQFNFQTNYSNTFNSHYLNVLAGMQTEEIKGKNISAGRKFFKYDGFDDLDYGDVASATNSGNHFEWAMLSFYGRINYNYQEKYLLEVNGRSDASTRFKGENRWGFFPSISAGWRLSEEPFFESLKSTVNNLKVRFSYGTLGNQAIGSYYPYAANIYSGYGYWFDYNQGTGVTQTEVANEKISWERSTQMTYGVDFDMFNSRLSTSFDIYNRNTSDMLQRFPIPGFIGLTAPWENRGDLENRGWELSTQWNDRIGDSFKYRVKLIVSDSKNKIKNLYGNEYINVSTITKEGYPINSYFGYLSDGLFQQQSEIDNSPVYGERQNIKPGYVKYIDVSGPNGEPDGVIDSHDRVILGSDMPRYEHSLNFDFEWKSFDLSLFFQGVGKKNLLYDGYGVRPLYVGRSMFKYQLDYWSEENPNAAFPILLVDGSGANPNNIPSDFWMKSGKYLRLKNITFGYTLPSTVTNRIGVSNLRLYMNVQNLLTFSDAYPGYDPENAVNGGSFYPLMKTFTWGLNLNF